MRRIGRTIFTMFVASWFTLADYMPVIAADTVAKPTVSEEVRKMNEEGLVLLASKNYHAAHAIFSEVVTKDEDNARARNALGIVFVAYGGQAKREGIVTGAVEWYDKAIAQHKLNLADNPDNFASNLNLGIAYCQKAIAQRNRGGLEAAIPHFDAALKIDSDHEKAQGWRTYIRKKTGK